MLEEIAYNINTNPKQYLPKILNQITILENFKKSVEYKL